MIEIPFTLTGLNTPVLILQHRHQLSTTYEGSMSALFNVKPLRSQPCSSPEWSPKSLRLWTHSQADSWTMYPRKMGVFARATFVSNASSWRPSILKPLSTPTGTPMFYPFAIPILLPKNARVEDGGSHSQRAQMKVLRHINLSRHFKLRMTCIWLQYSMMVMKHATTTNLDPFSLLAQVLWELYRLAWWKPCWLTKIQLLRNDCTHHGCLRTHC